jgi:hypothetical protein
MMNTGIRASSIIAHMKGTLSYFRLFPIHSVVSFVSPSKDFAEQ